MLYRDSTENGSLSSTQYLPETQIRVGVNGTTPVDTDTSLNQEVPILDGTALDNGDNMLHGS